MAHYKRGRRKNARAGCLMCKPHKANGLKGKLVNQTIQEKLSREDARLQLRELELAG